MVETTGDAWTVGAVIVHFHRERDVASLVHQLVTQHDVAIAHIVVMDNGSDPDLLRREMAAREVEPRIESLDNVGYAAAMNRGARLLPSKVDTLLLLTHEVVLNAGCVAELVAAVRSSPLMGAVGPLVLTEEGSLWSGGGELSPVRRLPRHRAHLEPVTAGPQEDIDCVWLDGSVVMLSRDTWIDVDGLDERFFLYAEDVDLGLRLNAAGRRVVVAVAARAQQSPSDGIDPYLWTRNTFLLLRRHDFRLARLLWLASVLVGLCRDCLFGRFRSAQVPRRWRALRDGLADRHGLPPRPSDPAPNRVGHRA